MKIKVKSLEECLKIQENLHSIGSNIFEKELAGKIFHVPDSLFFNAFKIHSTVTITVKDNFWHVPICFLDLPPLYIFNNQGKIYEL